MKIRSAVPENGCLIFFADGKKQKKTTKKQQKNICKTYTLPPHRRLRKSVFNNIAVYHFWVLFNRSIFQTIPGNTCFRNLTFGKLFQQELLLQLPPKRIKIHINK